MKKYLYEAIGPDGRVTKATVAALSVAEAHAQLTRSGHTGIRIRNDDLLHADLRGSDDPKIAAAMIDSAYSSLALMMVKASLRGWITWLPGLLALIAGLWFALSFLVWTGAALLLLAIVLIFMASLPAAAYQQVLLARANRSFARGLWWLGILRMAKPAGISAMMLDAEQAKLLAGLGRIDEGLALFTGHAGDADLVAYLTQLQAIHDTVGERAKQIDIQRQLLVVSGNSIEARLDLAWSLMRYTRDYDDARRLSAGIEPNACSALYAAGLRVVRALLLQVDGKHDAALAQFESVYAELRRYNSPLIDFTCRELRAYMALSFKASGRIAEAEALWQQEMPHMCAHHCDMLIARYDGI
ncbi:hypothetical protein [Massilia sp. CCM 8734]|uniref:hypothetical protein n=1 Tax=Massilia sp. CCM 8734 TaxID=2609283 RepID=UPI00141E4770|nr:hypothetical protein [Massilia sp. CCM 8734]NHZ96675.1 hypothetical protein [Massilia sp. CCM 8734]